MQQVGLVRFRTPLTLPCEDDHTASAQVPKSKVRDVYTYRHDNYGEIVGRNRRAALDIKAAAAPGTLLKINPTRWARAHGAGENQSGPDIAATRTAPLLVHLGSVQVVCDLLRARARPGLTLALA